MTGVAMLVPLSTAVAVLLVYQALGMFTPGAMTETQGPVLEK
jgi:hypothetical protein